MGGKNGAVASGRFGQAITEFLPRRTDNAPIEIRFCRPRVRLPRRCGCRKNNVIRVCRIHGNTPEVSVPQPFFVLLPGVATVAALEIAVAGCGIQPVGCGEVDRHLMRVSGTTRRPVLPSGPGVGAADERARFYGHKQPSLDVRVGFDPPNVVRLGPRRKTPFTRRRKRSQVAALYPGVASILGAKDRARFGPGVDNAATLHLLGSADRYGLDSRMPDTFTRRSPALPGIVAAPET